MSRVYTDLYVQLVNPSKQKKKEKNLAYLSARARIKRAEVPLVNRSSGFLTAAAGHRIAFHSLGAGASVGAVEVRAVGASAAGRSLALVYVPALVLGVALVALRALAPVSARQIYAESPSSAGSLVIALVHVDALRTGRRDRALENCREIRCSRPLVTRYYAV